jgi:hypothetical protein
MDPRRLLLAVVVMATAGVTSAAPAETSSRVFLSNGTALESYGDAARVDDRLVFNLIIRGAGDRFALELVSLPITSVDLPKTERYAEALRARVYASTRGEADYAAMSVEVAHALDQLSSVADKRQRLRLAEEARRRLLSWSDAHYGYRAKDIGELALLFDNVIAEMRAEAGVPGVSLELSRGPRPFAPEPILPQPAERQSLELARAAAAAADVPEERLAILRRAASMVPAGPAEAELRGALSADLERFARAEAAYAALVTAIDTRAAAALHRGDVAAVEALEREAAARDRALGFQRPRAMHALTDRLRKTLEATRAYRLALDHYDFVRHRLLAYERQIRPALSTLSGLTPTLGAIREMRSVAVEHLDRALDRLERVRAGLAAVTPPDDLAAVHTAMSGTVQMAIEACARRRQAIVTGRLQTAREAAAAAAGALLLVDQARRDLVAGLYPPRPHE